MICIALNPDDSLSYDPVTPVLDCSYVLLSPAEFSTAQDMTALYLQYFGFDQSLFSLVVVSCLTIFAVGYTAGAMMKAWSKTH